MSIIKIVSHVSLHKLTCFMRQRVASYRSDLCMLPVVSLITYGCKARVCLIYISYFQVHQKDTLDLSIHSSCLKALNDGGRLRLQQVLSREFKVKYIYI